MGLPATGRSKRLLAEVIEADVTEFLERAGRKVLADDDKVDDGVRRIVRQTALDEVGKKPEVTVVVSRISPG
jgi:ribonuclease J